MRFVAPASLLLLSLTEIAVSSPAEWPRLWGPSRNGVTSDRLTAAAKPEVLWRRSVAGGYSEIAVHNGRAFSMELRDGTDCIIALRVD